MEDCSQTRAAPAACMVLLLKHLQLLFTCGEACWDAPVLAAQCVFNMSRVKVFPLLLGDLSIRVVVSAL